MSYTIAEATKRANDLINKHLNSIPGQHWSLVWDSGKHRAGVCRYQTRTIGLSRVILPKMTEEAADDVILHEIAHALTGILHGVRRTDRRGKRLVHDDVWRGILIGIGGNGSRTWKNDDLEDGEEISAPIIGTCPGNHTPIKRHRKPTSIRSCLLCHRGFDTRFAIKWVWAESGIEILIGGNTAEQIRNPKPRNAQPSKPIYGDPKPTSPITTQHIFNSASTHIFVGDIVKVTDPKGRFTGEGTVTKVGTTRYHVKGLPGAATPGAIITVPFSMATKVGSTRVGGWQTPEPVAASTMAPVAPSVQSETIRIGDRVRYTGGTKHAGEGTVVSIGRTRMVVKDLPNSNGEAFSVSAIYLTKVASGTIEDVLAVLPKREFKVGDTVKVSGPGAGKFAGIGTVAKVNRTRYAITGLPNSRGEQVNVPFAMVSAV